jgi:hypothetical protein
MPDPYRRTLAELTTRYEFEPDLRDLYVEGATDRHFLVWFFLTSGASRVAVYESMKLPKFRTACSRSIVYRATVVE